MFLYFIETNSATLLNGLAKYVHKHLLDPFNDLTTLYRDFTFERYNTQSGRRHLRLLMNPLFKFGEDAVMLGIIV